MNTKFNPGDTVYFVESKWRIREVIILQISDGLAKIKFTDGQGGIRIHEDRLFSSKEAAQQGLRKNVP